MKLRKFQPFWKYTRAQIFTDLLLIRWITSGALFELMTQQYDRISGGYRTATTSKVKLFVIIVNGWKPLTIITKSSTLDIAAVLDPSLPSLHFLQYCECYGFERAFFTLRRFLPYTPSQYLAQPAFIKASLGAGSFSLKAAGPTTEFRNIDPVDLFLWITQFSENRISQ